MDRGHDGHSPLGLRSQHVDDSQRGRGVQPTCWLVKQEQTRLCYQLVANRGTLSLSTGNTSEHPAAHSLIRACFQAEALDDLIDNPCCFLFRVVCAHLASKLEKLARSHHFRENVILLYICSQLGVASFINHLFIDHDLTLSMTSRHQKCSLTEHVQQRSLARAAGAHDGDHLVRAQVPG